MKIYTQVIKHILITALILMLTPGCLFLPCKLYAQNNIMYVSPKMTVATNRISREFENNIIQKIPDVKTRVGYITYNDKQEGRDISYNKIRASSINYILKLNDIKVTGPSYELYFSLSKINDNNPVAERLFEEISIPWDNSTFVIKKDASLPKETDNILSDINDEIKYYFQNGKFRSRIFINPEDFEPADNDFYTTFTDWLEDEMKVTEHSNRSKYVVYYDDKPYPQTAPFILYGKFAATGQPWTEVHFYVINNTKTQKSRAVQINVEDFEYGNTENAEKYKQDVINKIYDLLGRFN